MNYIIFPILGLMIVYLIFRQVAMFIVKCFFDIFNHFSGLKRNETCFFLLLENKYLLHLVFKPTKIAHQNLIDSIINLGVPASIAQPCQTIVIFGPILRLAATNLHENYLTDEREHVFALRRFSSSFIEYRFNRLRTGIT